jgi:hypothetical protein
LDTKTKFRPRAHFRRDGFASVDLDASKVANKVFGIVSNVQAELWSKGYITEPMLVRQQTDDQSVDYLHWRDTVRELRLEI